MNDRQLVRLMQSLSRCANASSTRIDLSISQCILERLYIRQRLRVVDVWHWLAVSSVPLSDNLVRDGRERGEYIS